MQLSFVQKVGLGFAIIITLLSISGLSSLWNLNDIDSATSLVNETAIPVVKESNRVQIQLLKLGKLSALAFNATEHKNTVQYQSDFNSGVATFKTLFDSLDEIAKQNSSMQQQVQEIKLNYDAYELAVNAMFTAKLTALKLEEKVDQEAYDLIGIVDEVGASLADIIFFEVEEKNKEVMAEVAGIAGRVDDFLISMIKTIEEIKIANDSKKLEPLVGALAFSWTDIKTRMDRAVEMFKPMDTDDLISYYDKSQKALSERVDRKPGLVAIKLDQLKEVETARAKLNEADAAITKSVVGLDKLLKVADTQFNELQGQVDSSVDFGIKSSIVLLIVLIVLAAQNFNSMRIAIGKKVKDLAKLNQLGRSLASTQSQTQALEEVLQAMHHKIGVDYGSVFLVNDNQEFEIKAYFPPKVIEPGTEPVKFAMGEGVLGKAAESKRIIFVRNTAKDKDFKTTEEKPPKALLCVPLVDKDILVGVINLSGDVKKVVFSDSDYAFISSVGRSLVTTIKSIRMREMIEEHNRNLEAKVEERTFALKQKNEDIANMMANMHQGLFTITDGGIIHPEYSSYLETIYNTRDIANRKFSDLMFQHCNLSADAIDQTTTAVASIVGEDEMMFEFNSHLLRKEMSVYVGDDGDEKILELDWDPIISDDVVAKLMVTVRDVTALKALQAEAENQKQELEIIGEILSVDRGKFSEFIDGSLTFVDDCTKIITETLDKDIDTIATLFRNIHTVKGNARTYGFKHITEAAHLVEQTYDELRKNEQMTWEPSILLEELASAHRALEKYSAIYENKLGGDGNTASDIQIDRERVGALLDKIKGLTKGDVPEQLKSVVGEAYHTLISIEAKPIGEVIADVLASVNSLAKELEKAEPVINIHENSVFVKSEVHSTLNDIFMHVFRNAVDHGIESNEERVGKGKNEHGTITLNTIVDDDYAHFEVYDDGRGLAISKIFEKALENGAYQSVADRPKDIEVANLIFSSGFSTAEKVTEVSGRGVGMDAARGFIISQGGNIRVEFMDEAEGADFRAFKTVVSLPASLYIGLPEFARSA